MREKRINNAILLRVAAVLLVIFMLTVCMLSGRYARYTSNSSESDGARVAKFLVTQTGELTEATRVELVPSETIQLCVEVENGSEVDIEYSITANNPYNNLPLEFTFLEENTARTSAYLEPGEKKDVYLQIQWQTDKTQDRYIGMVDVVYLTVTAVQVD